MNEPRDAGRLTAEAPVTARDEAFLSPALAICAETMVDVRRREAAQAATNLAWGADTAM